MQITVPRSHQDSLLAVGVPSDYKIYAVPSPGANGSNVLIKSGNSRSLDEKNGGYRLDRESKMASAGRTIKMKRLGGHLPEQACSSLIGKGATQPRLASSGASWDDTSSRITMGMELSMVTPNSLGVSAATILHSINFYGVTPSPLKQTP
jgi:hypothetical protein